MLREALAVLLREPRVLARELLLVEVAVGPVPKENMEEDPKPWPTPGCASKEVPAIRDLMVTTVFKTAPTFSFMVLYVHRNHNAYSGHGAQEGHLDFHTAPEL